MKLRFFLWIVLVFLFAGVLFTVENLLLQNSLGDKTIRLHVVANSDSPSDQSLKLRVRDHVLSCVSDLTRDCRTVSQADAVLEQNLNLIQREAFDFLQKEGSSYDVKVSLCNEIFDTRYYDTFTLPAGTYRSLRISIGEGEGQNWWCVVFPSLCNAATEEALEDCAQWGGFETSESSLITGGTEKYILRFKVLEWVREIFRK